MITLTDGFCGAGGSSQGAHAVPGVEVRLAMNHWRLAVETHAANFPDVDHLVADISQVDPRYTPRTDIAWFSPECTNHSGAKGRRREDPSQPDLFGETLPDEAVERSRATMWDVVRFAEHHRYRSVMVENVVEVRHWAGWRGWLTAMHDFGYRHEIVWLNSMHAPGIHTDRAPQSRDRCYVVFTRAGDRAPDLAVRPRAWCETCGEVQAMQSWKRPDREAWGRYRTQYLYRCPHVTCRNAVVEPYVDPAATAIDWALRGQRIGDRARPLSEKTMARIRTGLARYAGSPFLTNHRGSPSEHRTSPITRPTATITASGNHLGLVVPLEGRDGKFAAPTTAPLRTQTARAETALVVPYYGTGVARPTGRELPTMGTVDTAGVAFIAELRGGGSTSRPVTEPLATFAASGTHHMLVRNATPTPAVEDCTFRMLEPAEIQRGMAFGDDYQVLGTRRAKVRQLGNAVTPPAAEWIVGRVVAALTGEDVV